MNTLIVFLKYPEQGKVKTRLAKDIGTDKAAEIYSRMARVIIENVIDTINYNTIIFYDPPGKEEEIKNWIARKDVEFLPQKGNTLGDRISNAFKKVFEIGSEKVVIIGSDCVDVTSDTINEAIMMLDNKDIVIGPAEDGGYYLLGLNKYCPEIFEDIDWSTDRVLDQTVTKLKDNNLDYKLLKTLKDIDNVYDLKDRFEDLLELTERD